MKRWVIILNIFLSLGLLIVSPIACRSHKTSQAENTNRMIDSLIRVRQVNDKTLLVTFGADAVTAVNTKKGIVIIDAGISTGLTGRYKKIIEDSFHSSNFAYVLITHAHHDHYRGSIVFSPVHIVGHINSLKEISRQMEDPQKTGQRLKRIAGEYDSLLQQKDLSVEEWNELFTQKMRSLYAYYDVSGNRNVLRPDITFEDSLELNMEDVTFHLLFFGKFHTDSDVLIFVPELKMLFVGDLFSEYGRPAIDESLISEENKKRWKLSLSWIDSHISSIKTIIGGHGQLLTLDDLKSFERKVSGY